MLYTVEGNLAAEDRQLRFIARQKINSALASIETKSIRIAQSLAGKIDAQVCRKFSLDQLSEMVIKHPSLQPERAVITRYTEAFPELAATVAGRSERVSRIVGKRLREAVEPFTYQQRFAYAKGLHH